MRNLTEHPITHEEVQTAMLNAAKHALDSGAIGDLDAFILGCLQAKAMDPKWFKMTFKDQDFFETP